MLFLQLQNLVQVLDHRGSSIVGIVGLGGGGVSVWFKNEFKSNGSSLIPRGSSSSFSLLFTQTIKINICIIVLSS